MFFRDGPPEKEAPLPSTPEGMLEEVLRLRRALIFTNLKLAKVVEKRERDSRSVRTELQKLSAKVVDLSTPTPGRVRMATLCSSDYPIVHYRHVDCPVCGIMAEINKKDGL